MFDIHKIKPVHGWREFVGEVGIIVLGVMIALGAESLIENWRWHEQTESTREAIKEDLLNNALYSWERMAVRNCLHDRLQQLIVSLQRSRGTWTGIPLTIGNNPNKYLIPRVYAAPYRPGLSDAWKNTLTSGVFIHLSKREETQYAELFGEVAVRDVLEEKEQDAANRLAPLAFDQKLDDRARDDAIAALAVVDQADATINSISASEISMIKNFHLGFDRKIIEDKRLELLQEQRRYRGPCVHALPLTLG